MKIAIVGSRDWPDLDEVAAHVARLTPDDVVVSGGAVGVDTTAVETARRLGIGFLVIPPDPHLPRARALRQRNERIVAYCDRLVAFWYRGTRGTRHAIELAAAAGKLAGVVRRS